MFRILYYVADNSCCFFPLQINMEVTLFLLSIIYFAVVMGQGPVAPGDFQPICRIDFRYREAHDWIPYVNPTSVGMRGEVRWQVLVDQYDYQNLIEPDQTPPSPWETRDIDGDGLQVCSYSMYYTCRLV